MSKAVNIGSGASPENAGLLDWLTTVDHKKLGILYLLTALFYLGVGGIEALLIRIQLARPESHFLGPDAYNQIFTIHGTTMIFLMAVPAIIGLGVYFVPLMIGARDMAFPRLNSFSYWLLFFGGLMIYFSFLAGGGAAAGWFSYAPLSETFYSRGHGVDYWALGLLAIGVGTVASAINFIVTVFRFRAPGMSLRRVPLFVWMVMVDSFLIIFAMPPFNAALAELVADRMLHAHFFTPETGGSAILWQHLFWSFGHPEVYIMILPAFGVISEVIPVFSRKPIYGYNFVAASTVAIAFLSFAVWAHHMFAVGLGDPVYFVFSAASMAIAVPTGVKIFNWTATMWGGRIRLTTAMLFAIAFLIDFTIGGLSGVMFAAVPNDWQLTDSFFVVAHLHYVLIGGTVFALSAGAYYWFPKMTGRMMSERIGKWHFWLMVIGLNMTFLVQHALGVLGMPRRVHTYPDLPYMGTLNMISTIGAFVLGFSVLLFVINLVLSKRWGARAGPNPWEGWTLEWATSSPPPPEDFETVPPIRSRRPLWDLAHPESADWKVQGGRREATADG
ncbi:MAG: cytochrome c oxidase subunit I [Gemmatimonadales bacterium]